MCDSPYASKWRNRHFEYKCLHEKKIIQLGLDKKINATTTEIAAGDNHKIWNTNNAWGEPHKLLAVEHQCFKIQLL